VNLVDIARATEDPVRKIPAGYMLAAKTVARGAELGFSGNDFYFAGRGGVLGDVDADVVTAAFTFVNPATLRVAWERSGSVLPRARAAAEFANCQTVWAQEHIPDDFPSAHLASLLHPVTAAAGVDLAPVFAAWRARPVPVQPASRLLFELNLLRELRGAKHMAAVLAEGLDPGDAVRHRSPYVMDLFGWPGDVSEGARAEVVRRWDAAEERTQHLIAPAFGVLPQARRQELAELLGNLLDTVA
jgi:hypothetical protein